MTDHPDERHPSAEHLTAFLDGELRAAEHVDVEEHVRGCARCAGELDAWRILYAELAELPELVPSATFPERVLAGIRTSAPAEGRLGSWIRALVGPLVDRHVAAGRLQDFVEGALTAAQATRVEAHLGTCAACAAESREVRALFERLSSLERFGPSPAFADRVMASLVAPAPAPARTAPAVPGWTRLLAAARGLLPRTRRAWATLSGVAVTPAVTVGLMLWVVFSHPTLTPAALVSFAWWKVTGLAGVAWQAVTAATLESTQLFDLYALGEAVSASPLAVAGGVLAYSLSCALALRVLYKNLFAPRPVSVTRHA